MDSNDKSTDGATLPDFDAIRHTGENGAEFWFARELYPLLGYSSWQRFTRVLDRAKQACISLNIKVDDHFNVVVKMVGIGSGSERQIEDISLSRYACYLIVQNGDPNKPIIAAGQTYFAVQTRRQELADAEAFKRLSEDERRLLQRSQIKEQNKKLFAAAHDAGVETNIEYGAFQNSGYRGLYDGLDRAAIHKKKGLKKSHDILDYMGSEELAANLFRTTQTEAKLKRDHIKGKAQANQTHFNVGRAVRKTIEDLGGTMPEDLPTPEKGIPQLERERNKRIGLSGPRKKLIRKK